MKLDIVLVPTRLVLTLGAIFFDGWAHSWIQRLGARTRTPLMRL